MESSDLSMPLHRPLRPGTFRWTIPTAAAVLLALSALCQGTLAAAGTDDELSERIRRRLGGTEVILKSSARGEMVHASKALPEFYQRREFRPAWSSGGVLGTGTEPLLERLRAAESHGLRGADYHLDTLEALLGRIPANGMSRPARLPEAAIVDLVDADILATDAFLVFAAHLLAGRTNPYTVDPEWHAQRRGADLAAVLERALGSGDIQGELDRLAPPQKGYWRLREALAHYRELAGAGGWEPVPPGPKLGSGSSGPRVRALRQRLAVTGDGGAGLNEDPERFDEFLEAAVRRFQERHGLEPDGIVGRGTLRELNVSAEGRVRQIEVNMERWRWLPQDLGSRYVLVNSADFRLDVVEDGKTVFESKAIVGKTYRRTPVFSADMTYLVFNPSWIVPPTIAREDILPGVQKDPSFLASKNLKVFTGRGKDLRDVDPASVDWAAMTPETLSLRFRQEPGSANPLGKVKFILQNDFDVYIHDTPAKELFAKSARGFSSGCVRIERAVELAEYLLRDDPRWGPREIAAAIDEGKERIVKLSIPIPVHMLYWTAWPREDGTMEFRGDIYGRDAKLGRALARPAPRKGFSVQ